MTLSASAYASASDVAAYTPNLLDGNPTFDATTLPTRDQVVRFLSIGAGIINTHLAARGFATPAASGTDGRLWLSQLNTYYGVAQAEKVRTNATVSPGERTRAQQFEASFWDGIKQLDAMDLTFMGLTPAVSNRATIYGGGISVTDKESVTDNDDNTKPRFSKNQFATWVND